MIQRDPGEDNLRGPFLRPAESGVLRVLGDLGQHVEARICSRKDLSRRRINCLRHIGFFSPLPPPVHSLLLGQLPRKSSFRLWTFFFPSGKIKIIN